MTEQRRYGPDEVWHEHDCDEWNKVLDLARSKGWSFIKFRSHRFGKPLCPGGRCEFPTIDSSATATETFARQKMRIIERCRCRPADDIPLMERATKHIVQGERLVGAADRLLARDAARAEVEDLLSEVSDNAEEAEKALAAAEAAEERAAQAGRAADRGLAEASYGGDRSTEGVLDAGETQIDLAEAALGPVTPKRPEKGPLAQRLESLKADAERLRVQVDGPVSR